MRGTIRKTLRFLRQAALSHVRSLQRKLFHRRQRDALHGHVRLLPGTYKRGAMNAPSLVMEIRLDDEADALEAYNEKMAKAKAPLYLTQAEFWTDLFADESPQFLDAPLAECMTHLKAACEGDPIARDAICRALHQIERQALPLAEEALTVVFITGGKDPN